MTIRIIIGAIAAGAAIVLAAACTAAASATPAARHPGGCAAVVIAQRTRTGHEADLPLTFCGLHRRGSWYCAVTPWGPLQAGARLDCKRT